MLKKYFLTIKSTIISVVASQEDIELMKEYCEELLEYKETELSVATTRSKSVYMHVEEKPYIKLIVPVEFVDEFLAIGFTRNQAKADVKEEASTITGDPAKGFGKPGTYEWHKVQLATLKKHSEVINYVFEVTGIDLSLKYDLRKIGRSELDKDALETIQEFLKED